MKQRQLKGIEDMSTAHARLLREDKNRKLLLYAAILEIEFNPPQEEDERKRINKLVKQLRRGL